MLSFLLCYVVCLSLSLYLIPFLGNIEMRGEGGHFLDGVAESSFHGNSMQSISMRTAYCNCANVLAQTFCKVSFQFGTVLLLQRVQLVIPKVMMVW